MNSCNRCGALERSALCPLVEPIPPAYDLPLDAREQGNAMARALADELRKGMS
jgi:hypothetical protein